MSDKVLIFDTTLRDGEQSPGFSMNVGEKLRMAEQLRKLKVDVIEAGFPIASEGDFEAVKAVAKACKGPQIAGLARTGNDDIDRAWEAIKFSERPRLHTFIATSDIHLRYKLKKTREEVLKDVVRAVKRARRYTDNVEFSAEDATRSDPEYLIQVVAAAIEAGARTINIPDTVGYTTPTEYHALIKTLREEVKGIDDVVISVHCHDDLGLATANSLSAVLAGARQVECTVNGIGERAGNTAMEEVVMGIRTRKDFFGLETNIATEQIYAASRLLSQITGVTVQPNKAVVGTNAFAHEAGIHQDGVLKKKITYEIMTPESIGVPSSILVLGKHSGRHAFKERLKVLGYELNLQQIDAAFKAFKSLADRKKEVFDEDLEAIISGDILRLQVPEKYILMSLNVVSGSEAIPTATVQLKRDGEMVKDAGFGDGPVDATYKTIAKMTGTKSRLLKYSVQAITGGTEAQGEVTVNLEEDGKTVVGRGAHTDIIMASAKAYINALNKLEHIKEMRRRVYSP